MSFLWLSSRNYSRLEAPAIRVIVPLVAVASVAIAWRLDVPRTLPAAALGSKWILFGLRAIAIFYGVLLILVPVLRALRGQLPIELSLRGAKYEEGAAATSDALKELRSDLDSNVAVVDSLTSSVGVAVRRIATLEDAQQEASRSGFFTRWLDPKRARTP